jgi:hypothetical protein
MPIQSHTLRASLTTSSLLLLLGIGAAAAADPRPKTLYNSGDPTLTLTPPLGGARTAPKGSPAPSTDPRNLEGVWWVQGYEYMLGPAPGDPPPLKPEYLKVLERRIRAKNQALPRRTPRRSASLTGCHG